ncbi:MAG: CPBP family intramembrane metalloprotease [Lachnospiraceae bacterium]|nr:CPBP family intramembrane metalloprotease [Lachnospiraceae bacterium]
MKRHITLLALDTATRNTGYCVFENGKIIKTGVISTKAKEPLDASFVNRIIDRFKNPMRLLMNPGPVVYYIALETVDFIFRLDHSEFGTGGIMGNEKRIDNSSLKENGDVGKKEYATHARTFEGYKWYKPLLVALLTFAFMGVLEFLLFGVVAIYSIAVGDNIRDIIDGMRNGFDSLDAYTVQGALISLGSIAMVVPALFLATKIIRYRPFGSYISLADKWRMKPFLICFLVSVIAVGIPNMIQIILTSENTHTIRFTVLGFILCILLVPLQSLAEEFLFRSLVMQTFGGWIKISVVAIIIQAVLFSLLHPYSIFGVIEVLFAGLIMGFTAHLTGGIEAGAAVHMVANLSIYILNGFGFKSIKTNVSISGVITALVLYSVFFAAILILKKKTKLFRVSD